MAQVQSNSFLTLHYRLGGVDGADIVNTFGGPAATLSLGSGELAPALEQRLLGLEEGAQVRFDLPAGEVFGQPNADLLQWVGRKLLNEFGDPDEQYQVGDVLHFPTPDGTGRYAGTVRQVRDDAAGQSLLFDFNHPLAGQALQFEVQVIGVL